MPNSTRLQRPIPITEPTSTLHWENRCSPSPNLKGPNKKSPGNHPGSFYLSKRLGVYSTHLQSPHDAIDRECVGGGAVARVARVLDRAQFAEVGEQHVFELLVDLGLFPKVTHTVLCPLEVRDGHTAGVGH